MVDEELKDITAFEEKRKAMGMSPSEFYAIPREPPSESKLPIFDEAHVRNAMARFNQIKGVSPAEKASAKRKIMAKAKKFGIDVQAFEKLAVEQLPPAFDEMVKSIKKNLMGKTNPRTGKPYTESDIYAIAQAQWKKTHGGEAA